MNDEMRSSAKKIFDDYEARMREHDRKIDEAWNEIDRRRRKAAIIILSALAGVVGLVYYLS